MRAARLLLRVASLALAQTVHGASSFELAPGVSVTPKLRLGFAAVVMENANLGRGRLDLLTNRDLGEANWAETVLRPALAVTIASGAYGEFAAVGATTYGDGDPLGFTRDGDGKFALETAVLGWRRETPSADAWSVDISLGR